MTESKKVYVAVCVPGTNGGVGGFEWRVDRAEAEAEFRSFLKDVADEIADHAIILLEYTPEATDPEGITQEIDEQVDELALSGEGRLFARIGERVEAEQFAYSQGAIEGEEFDAWVAFHLEEGEGWPGVTYRGTFDDDIAFTKDVVMGLMDIPSYLVVNWEATSNLVTDYTSVTLPNGRKAYFR